MLNNEAICEEQPYILEYTGDAKIAINDPEQSEIMFFLMKERPHCSMVYTWDEIGMAALLTDAYHDSMRFCPQQKSWYIWEGRWKKQNEEGVIHDRLQTLLNALLIYCKEVAFSDPNDEFVKDYEKYIKSIRRFTSMKNIIATLSSSVRLNLMDMDNNPYILNTTNHAYDLKTGKIVEDITPYNVTKRTTCMLPDFITTRCDRWYQFIDEIMEGDKEKAAFLQRALGYSMLGVNREECMFMAYGSKTRNGKGTLFSTISAVLGEDYANTAPTDLICESKTGRSSDLNAPQPVLSSLTGTRIVTMAESSKDVRLDAANMKTMTGRDTLVTRGLFENSFRFVPQFTLWLNTNYLPAVTDDTVFSSNRIWVIEFNRHFDDTTQDKDLKELFSAPENRPTILQWLFDGCRDYMEHGLNVPQCVKDATASYRKLHDRIGCFIEESCEVKDGNKILRGDLYRMYRQWCVKAENQYKPLGSTTFYSEMAIRGFPAHKSDGNWYVIGINARGA